MFVIPNYSISWTLPETWVNKSEGAHVRNNFGFDAVRVNVVVCFLLSKRIEIFINFTTIFKSDTCDILFVHIAEASAVHSRTKWSLMERRGCFSVLQKCSRTQKKSRAPSDYRSSRRRSPSNLGALSDGRTKEQEGEIRTCESSSFIINVPSFHFPHGYSSVLLGSRSEIKKHGKRSRAKNTIEKLQTAAQRIGRGPSEAFRATHLDHSIFYHIKSISYHAQNSTATFAPSRHVNQAFNAPNVKKQNPSTTEKLHESFTARRDLSVRAFRTQWTRSLFEPILRR